ncbi:glutaredoxin [Melghiribacillus thermohalophilus]|uniref:Glutaredoxin n=1 Tax=Melghiribacillus thermohalophilus TaxID=1324956 RepID=A0A4R3MZ59_9BACI|nr:glutaredoxin family protein [Melghiribacillus thermohalophilus]TCT21137.1 glutaredoxin [Melghiribacillus thermohalophilus]
MKPVSEIIIYTNEQCGFCKQQLDWMRKNGIHYTIKDVKNNEEHRSELIKFGARGTPFTIIKTGSEEHKVLGFNKAKLEKLLL